jgi:Glyoxalase-like domain
VAFDRTIGRDTIRRGQLRRGEQRRYPAGAPLGRGSQPVLRIREIVIDALQPAALARFWAAALDGYALRAYDRAEIDRLAAVGRCPETDPCVALDGPGPTLFFQETAIPKPGRNRLHLDLVGGPRASEIQRLCALGATVREARETDSVLQDPEGNEFCVQDAR